MYYIHNPELQHKESFNTFEEAQNRAIHLSQEMFVDFNIFEYDSTSELFMMTITYMSSEPWFPKEVEEILF